MESKTLALAALINDEHSLESQRVSSLLQDLPESSAIDSLCDAMEVLQKTRATRDVSDLEQRIARRVKNAGALDDYVKAVEAYIGSGVTIVSFWSKEYPEELRGVQNPPLLLYVKGLVFPGKSRVAIVGTRRPSKMGQGLAHDYAHHLANQGHTIVSGLARGIDTAAHEGALTADGATIAVLGNPITEIYPKENEALAIKIRRRGSIVSEMSHLARMHRGRFVERNRIISGISEAVLIAESSADGGTIHQARFALEQKKRVYVIDQGIFEGKDVEAGFRKLVDMGATPITSPYQITTLSKKGGQIKIEDFLDER